MGVMSSGTIPTLSKKLFFPSVITFLLLEDVVVFAESRANFDPVEEVGHFSAILEALKSGADGAALPSSADLNAISADEVLTRGGTLPFFRRFLERCERIEPYFTQVFMERAATSYQCVRDLFNLHDLAAKIQVAIEESNGGLNDLFHDYCDKWDAFLACLAPLRSLMNRCLRSQESTNIDSAEEAVVSVKNYICEDGGNKIAMFFGFEGIECLNGTTGAIQQCTVDAENHLSQRVDLQGIEDISEFEVIRDVLCQDYRAFRKCLLKALQNSPHICKKEEPGDLVEGLFKAFEQKSTCRPLLNTSVRWSSPITTLLSLAFFLFLVH